MEVIFVLVPITLFITALAIWAFFWSVDSGQFDHADREGFDAVFGGSEPVSSDRTRNSARSRAGE